MLEARVHKHCNQQVKIRTVTDMCFTDLPLQRGGGGGGRGRGRGRGEGSWRQNWNYQSRVTSAREQRQSGAKGENRGANEGAGENKYFPPRVLSGTFGSVGCLDVKCTHKAF